MRLPGGERLDALLDTPLTCTDEERMDAHYTLGEYFDRYGQYDLAFKHMTAGNALRPTRYDAARTRRAVDIMEATTTREFMERAPRSTRTSALPVFIVGMPRSGTTLIEQVLGRHSRVHAAGELLDIQNIGREIDQTLGAPEGFPACMSRIGVADLDRRADAYLERLRGFDATAERVIDKLPANWMFLGLIAQMLPGARIIHARRHPLDTCLSCYQQNFSYGLDFSLRLETLADHYLDYRRLMRHWQSVLTLPMIEVVYEEHIEDPEGTARRLVEFLGLAWEDQCLDHRSERIVRTASYEQVRQPIYRGSVARWKRYATHLAVLESRLAEYL